MAQTRYFASLSSYAILKFVPHTAARCCCHKQQHKTPCTQQAVDESSGAVRSRKAQCQALPDNPETGDTYHTSSSRERSCAVARKEKIEHQKNVSKRHSHHHPPHDSKQHNYWVELVRVCRLAVVAAAAACCSYCDKENPPPPNDNYAQLAGRVVRTLVLVIGGN